MIYFIATPDRSRIKIGTTIRLSQRLKQLAAEHGDGLQVLAVLDGGHAEERALHRRFIGLRVVNEWFEPGDDLMGFIVAEGREWDGSDEVPLSGLGTEVRKHTAMIRVDAETLEQAKLAASMMKMTLADYASDVLRKAADRDVSREAKKLAGGDR